MVTLCKIICDHTHVHGAHRPGPISVQNDLKFETQSFLTRGYGGGKGERSCQDCFMDLNF